MKDKTTAQDRMKAAGAAPASLPLGNALAKGQWKAEIRDPEGKLIDVLTWENLIVDTGLNQLLDSGLASDGTGEVSLNLDITDDLTAKGTLESDGNSSIGIFFERDY